MKRVLCSALAAATLATAPAPAFARDGWNAAAAIIGAAGGLAVGSAIANSNSYYPGKPVYIAPRPRPVYVETIDEVPACYVKQRRYVNEFGDEVIRRVRVCR